MELIRLLCLFLSYVAVASSPSWSNKPGILLSDDEIVDGETMTITCLVPIDYGGGTCRLYRKHSTVPFRRMTANRFSCGFHLTTSELLGSRPVGSVVRFRCDYILQQYTSESSDGAALIVWGSRPSPTFSISHQIVSSKDTVELTCTPPPHESTSKCDFYRDQYRIKSASCTHNITGSELVIWKNPSVLRPVNVTCRYHPSRYIRSEPSNHHMMFVVDAAEAASSMLCRVSLEHGEGEWAFDGGNGRTVTVRASSSDQHANNTCVAVSCC